MEDAPRTPASAAPAASLDTPQQRARLELSRAEFVAAMAPLRAAADSFELRGDALLGFDGHRLHVDFAVGCGVAVAAQGAWPGEARIPARYALQLPGWLAAVPDEEVTLRLQPGFIFLATSVGVSRLPCVWETTPRPRLELALGQTLVQRLRITLPRPNAELQRAGALGMTNQDLYEARSSFLEALPHLEALGIGEYELWELIFPGAGAIMCGRLHKR